MSVFTKIMDRVLHRKTDQGATATPATPSNPPTTTPVSTPAPAATPPPVAAPPVDVEAVLTRMAELEGGGGNWRTSIVDLLKLLKLDSSLDARRELAQELGVNAGDAGSAEQNIALHRAVMRKLAENGGIVPDSFYV